jgi:hypothetical protein
MVHPVSIVNQETGEKHSVRMPLLEKKRNLEVSEKRRQKTDAESRNARTKQTEIENRIRPWNDKRQ